MHTKQPNIQLNRCLMISVCLATSLLSNAALATTPAPAATERTTHTPEMQWSIASDIAPWFFSGYSVIGMLERGPWRATVETWGFDFPKSIVEWTDDNTGWTRKVNGAVLYADYHFNEDASGLHLGMAINLMYSRFALAQNTTTAWTMELVPRIGYRWFPVKTWGLFADAWAAPGIPLFLGDAPTINGRTFKELPIQPLVTAHVGWRF